MVCNLAKLGARYGVYLMMEGSGSKVEECLRVNANGCGSDATEFCASVNVFAYHRRCNISTSSLFGMLANCSAPPRCGGFVITPRKVHPFFRTVVVRRARGTGLKLPTGVATGIGSLISPRVVDLLCSTSGTNMGVSLVMENVYYLIPKIRKFDRGVEMVSVINRLLRRDQVFVFRGGSGPLCCVKDTS